MPESLPSRRELVTYGGDPTDAPPQHLSMAKRLAANSRRSPVLTAVVAAAAVAALSVGVVGTAATFNDEVKIGVDVATGTLNINVDGQEGNPTPVQWTLPDSQLKPGQSTTYTKSVNNTGTLPAVVTASMVGLGPSSLGAQLDAVLSAGPGGALAANQGKANGVTLGAFTVPPGGSVPLTLTLFLPADTANTWQGKTDTLTLTLTAVQE